MEGESREETQGGQPEMKVNELPRQEENVKGVMKMPQGDSSGDLKEVSSEAWCGRTAFSATFSCDI